MLRQATPLNAPTAKATDRIIGHVEDAYFDDEGLAIPRVSTNSTIATPMVSETTGTGATCGG